MRPTRVIQGTFLGMMLVQTIGSTDSQHRLPSPRQFVAVFVLWSIFFIMAGGRFARATARLSVLVLLTGMVIGPFGKTVVTFLQNIAKNYPFTPGGIAPGQGFQGGIGGGDFGSSPTTTGDTPTIS